MKRINLFRLIIMLHIFLGTIYGNNFNEIVIKNNQKVINNFKFNYLNTTTKLSIEEVTNKRFLKEMSNNFSLGYIKGDLWIKIKIRNNSNITDFILTINEHFYEKANLYFFDKKWQKKENGLFLPIEKREIKTNKLSFPLTLEENQSKTYYLQLEGKYSYFGKISVYGKEDFFLKEQIYTNGFFSFIFGIFFLVLTFTLFLFLKIKEKVYFFYLGYSFFYLIYMINISGMLAYFDLQYYVYKLHSAGAFSIAFFALFSMEYLKIKKHYKVFTFILYTLILGLIICGTFTIFEYTPWNKIINNIIGLVNILLIFSAIVMYRKGYDYAKYYILIMLSFFTFVFLFTMMVSGKIEYNLISRYGYIFASTLELIFFTLLLVNNYAVAKNKYIKYQGDLLIFKENQKVVLEEEVEKRTEELNETNKKLSNLVNERELLLKEVFHRVKNNFHMIIGMLWFESQKHNDKDVFTELTNRIKSMSKLHEHLLYSSGNLKHIQTKDYLQGIIDNIITSYSKKEFYINYRIDNTSLDFEEALSLGIIINEIISNSIKHNSNENNHIFLSFKEVNDNLKLEIRDNGKEFSQMKKGLGLNLVDEFSKKLNSSKYFFSFEKGTCFTLEFLKKVDE